jgi:hypothetical protein
MARLYTRDCTLAVLFRIVNGCVTADASALADELKRIVGNVQKLD